MGGPLPQMPANAPLHLRILLDHSCLEAYTGTGEVRSVLESRVYKPQATAAMRPPHSS